jgi:hypothetical protein
MENIIDLYTISFIILLGVTIAGLIGIMIFRLVKSIRKAYKKNARREARRKMRVMRNELIKNNRNQNINAMN